MRQSRPDTVKWVLLIAVVISLGSARCASKSAPVVADHQEKSTANEIWDSGEAVRQVAETREDQEQMEEKFQSILNSTNPEAGLIDSADQLFTLLIQANIGIEKFDHELDVKLAKHRRYPKALIEEPLHSKTYSRLLKMWQLRDRYQSEIVYMYLRLMQVRTDADSSVELKDRARNMQIAVEKHLKATQNLKRVELQDLTRELVEVYKSFTREYIARVRGTGALSGAVAKTDAVPAADMESALLDEQSVRTFMANHPNGIPSAPLDNINKARHELFLQKIEADLANIPAPDFTSERAPQSVGEMAVSEAAVGASAVGAIVGGANSAASPKASAVSGGPAAWGSKIFPSTGENGNMFGQNFPAGVWAFTFDDGPAVKSTGDLLDYLDSYHDSINPKARATFFWLARNVPHYPNWVKRAYDSRYPFENHSWTHPDLSKMSSAVRHHEIVDANVLLTSEYRKVDPNYVIKFFRCPYGSCFAPKVPEVRQIIANLGLVHVYWRIDSLDWKLLNGPRTAALVEKQMQLLDHGVILMHDIHPTTVDAVKIVLPWMKDQNDHHGAHYKMVTIPEGVDMVNGNIH